MTEDSATDDHTNRSASYTFWRCPNCGQTLFSDVPPDTCAFCDDFTTWQLVMDRAETRIQLPMFPDDPHHIPSNANKPRTKKR